MFDILLKAVSYLLMILVAYFFKKIGLTKASDGDAMAKICLKVTLPCAIISSFAAFDLMYSLLIVVAFGAIGNVLQLLCGYFMGRGKSREDRIFFLANAGYNIGNFTLPFTSSFMGPLGIVTTSLFDVGNALMLFGCNYSIAERAANGKQKTNIPFIIKRLLSTPAFDTYLIMMTIVLLGLEVPRPIVLIASEFGKANGPLAMFMIGTMMEISFEKRYIKSTLKVMAARIAIALVFSLAFSFMSFLPEEARKAAIIVSWSPIGSACAAYIAFLDGDKALGSFVSTVSILFALVVIPVLSIVL